MSTPKQLFRFGPGDSLATLLNRNSAWSARLKSLRPSLFPTNAQGQSPQILWIGCSDSRAGEACLDLLPGEVFVHRNIANVMPHGDLNSLSVIQFAVEVLKVKHIIVCGHYDCGGVWASLTTKKLGLIDNWLRHIRDVKVKHKDVLDKLEDPREKANKLVELNVISQVHNIRRNSSVLEAIKDRGLQVHGLIYNVADGLLTEIDVPEDHDSHEYFITSDSDYQH